MGLKSDKNHSKEEPIDSRIDEVTAQVKKAVGDIPFIMEFTFGEYGYEDDGNNTCGGLMLSFTAFGK